MEINPIRIGRVVTETHPHFAYWCETKHGFKTDDILTTHLGEMPADKDIYVVKEVIDDHVLCTNKVIIAPAAGQYLRKLTTVSEITSKINNANMEKAIREQDIRDKMRELFLGEPFEGTIEQRLLDGYLYTISQEDLSLPPDHEDRKAMRHPGQRATMIQTGRAGVLSYIEAGKRQGHKEGTIARSIWVEMIVEGVKMFVNIKNLKVTKYEKDTTEKESGKPEKPADKKKTIQERRDEDRPGYEEDDKPRLGHWNQD